MGWWVAYALAWLLGVYWQTGEQALSPVWVYALATGVSCALVGMAWLRPGWRGMGIVAVLVLAWAATGWRACVRMQEALPPDWVGRDIQVRVQVEGLPQPVPGGALLDARVLQWLPAGDEAAGVTTTDWPRHLSLRMALATRALPVAGQQWLLPVQLHAPEGSANPGGYDSSLALFERGVRAVGRVRGKVAAAMLVQDRPEWPWQAGLDRGRQHIRTAIFSHVPDTRAAGILAGLAVGDQSAIEQDDWTLFRQTGVAHLVSISGAHIAMFGWLAAWLFRRLWSLWPAGMHRWPAPDVAMWAAVCASGLYALLSGWGVPAQRTVWMMAGVCCLRASGRRWPWPLVWLISAVGLTALDPWAIRQAGFWLSYVAVGVVLSTGMRAAEQPAQPGLGAAGPDPVRASGPRRLCASVSRALRRLAAACVDLLRVQTLITLALMPLSLVVFQQASLNSLLANLLAIPVFTLGITPMALLGVIWAPCWDAGAWMIDGLMHGLEALVRVWPAMASSPVLPAWVALCGVMAGAALALPMRGRWRLGLLPFGLPLLWLPQSWHALPAPQPGRFALVAADVGQGTAVLVRTAHHNLLFDAGPRVGAHVNAGDRILLPMFRALGVSRLQMLVISHQDTDHVGGAPAIVRQLPVAQLMSSLLASHPLRHQPGVNGQALPHASCLAGMQWQWDGVQFEVLHPSVPGRAAGRGQATNALSCVLKVSAAGPQGASALLTGDIEADQEAQLVARDAARLRSTVLVAAHHGSKTSSTEGFLRAVQPDQVVIQAGRRNRYGHPSPLVLARLEALSMNWVATPACGAFVWSSEEGERRAPEGGLAGASPRIGQCWRGGHHRYWDQAYAMPSR